MATAYTKEAWARLQARDPKPEGMCHSILPAPYPGAEYFRHFIDPEREGPKETDGLVLLGSIHRDMRCTGQEPFFCRPEHETEARKLFDWMSRRRAEEIERYYSRPWV